MKNIKHYWHFILDLVLLLWIYEDYLFYLSIVYKIVLFTFFVWFWIGRKLRITVFLHLMIIIISLIKSSTIFFKLENMKNFGKLKYADAWYVLPAASKKQEKMFMSFIGIFLNYDLGLKNDKSLTKIMNNLKDFKSIAFLWEGYGRWMQRGICRGTNGKKFRE